MFPYLLSPSYWCLNIDFLNHRLGYKKRQENLPNPYWIRHAIGDDHSRRPLLLLRELPPRRGSSADWLTWHWQYRQLSNQFPINRRTVDGGWTNERTARLMELPGCGLDRMGRTDVDANDRRRKRVWKREGRTTTMMGSSGFVWITKNAIRGLGSVVLIGLRLLDHTDQGKLAI